MRRILSFAAVFAVAVVFSSAVQGQGFGGGGAFGSQSFGSNQTGGSNQFGIGGGTGSSFGNTGGGFGSTGGGLGSTGGGLGVTNVGAIGSGGFVGADSTDTGNLRTQAGNRGGLSQGGGGGGLGGGGLGQLGNQFATQFGGGALGGARGGQANQGGGNAGNQTRQVRTRVRLGFTPVAPPAGQVAAALSLRLSKYRQFGPGSLFDVAVDGRTVVLRGTVASAHQRDLAARLAMLEPGVSAVRNEIVVSGGTEDIPAPP